MDAESWRRTDEVFAEALEIPAGERERFLAAACGGDDALRAAVERLLAADSRAGEFLGTPALLSSDALLSEEDDAAGRRLGPYTLLRPLGQGGMGTVYLATRDDGAYDRQVAVKLLRWSFADGDLLHRFLAERQILARLEHPHIARLYDGGTTEDGQPYLVLEHVEGLPLDVYCDTHHLSLEARLALFRKVCAAVQHAHRNLLVHRDLKPANVLVTAEGEPKLLDFGIAKQLATGLETDAETRTGLRVMTPGYASPEQMRGEAVTTASDVYSLGVLLYELLSGRSPYRVSAETPFALERAVLEEVPEKPSDAAARGSEAENAAVAQARGSRPAELRRRLRGDLDNIVLMALRKEPARRYGSVAELEGDLDRFLTRRPVTARRDSLGYRTGLFVRRHRWSVAAGVLVALLTAGLLAGLIAQSVRAAREGDKAQRALAFLVDVFKQSDPYQTGGERVTPQQILAQGAARVERELEDQPEVQAALMDAIGQVYLGLGLPDRAEPLLEGALARRRAAGAAPLEEAASLQSLADLRLYRSDLPRAAKLYEEALQLERRALGKDDRIVAGTLARLAGVRSQMQRPDEAEALLRQALQIHRARGQEGAAEAARVLVDLAALERQRARFAAAETLCTEALALQRRSLGPGHPDLARTLQVMAGARRDTGDHAGAEKLLREALAIQQTALEEGHPERVAVVDDLALTLFHRGRLDDAYVLHEEALAQLRARLGNEHGKVADALDNLGAIDYGLRRNAKAGRLHEEALVIRRRLYGERHVDVARSLLQIGRVRYQDNLLDEAEAAQRRSLDILIGLLGEGNPLTAYPLVDLGQIAIARKQWKDAEGYYRRAVAIRARALPANHFETARARSQLGESLVRQGRYEEAEPLLRTALDTIHPQFPAYDKRTADVRKRVVDLYRSWGKEAEARKIEEAGE